MLWAIVAQFWTQWGHDPQNTFRAEGAGEISEEPTIIWKVTDAQSKCVPLIADVNGDGAGEVVVLDAAIDGIRVLNGKTGALLWSFQPPDTEMLRFDLEGRGLVSGDFNGDGLPEIAFGTDKALYFVSSSGSLLWSLPFQLGGFPSKAADVDGDGLPEILATIYDTAYYAVTYAIDGDGTVIWNQLGSSIEGVGDVDGDAQPEVLTFDPPTLMILDGATGEIEDTLRLGLDAVSLGDLDGDGVLEIVLGTNGIPREVKVFDKTSDGWEVIWSWADTLNDDLGQLALGDLNGDGIEDVVCKPDWDAEREYWVVALNGADGSELWATPSGANGASLFYTLADIDGDGRLEVLVTANRDSTLLCLNGEDGSELWGVDARLDNTGGIISGDLDGDGKLEVVFEIVYQGVGGRLAALDVSAGEGEQASRPNAIVNGGRGSLIIESPNPAQILIYSEDGRLLKALKLQPGRTLVPLKPGVYFWKAGELSGKAVVKP